MIFISDDNLDQRSCESCQLALATLAAIDEDGTFLVCERCVPTLARWQYDPELLRVPVQVRP